MRGDAFRLAIGHRKPVPKRIDGIGTWKKVLLFETVVAVAVGSGLVVVSTGQYEFFFSQCHKHVGRDSGVMGPDLSCPYVGGYTARLMIGLALEHLGFMLLYMMFNSFKNYRNKY